MVSSTSDNSFVSGWFLGMMFILFVTVFISIPVSSSVPQCQEDEVVTVDTYLWVKVPDKCVNREDANYEFGFWTTSE